MKNTHFLMWSLLPLSLLLLPKRAFCQSGGGNKFSLVIVNDQRQPVSGATVRLIRNGRVVSSKVAGENGEAIFEVGGRESGGNKGVVAGGGYRALVSCTGYQPKTTDEFRIPAAGTVGAAAGTLRRDTIELLPLNKSLQEVTVTAHTPPIERVRGKTVVNVEASVTNMGATVLEVLERSPGVTVDQNGGISLNGRQGVLVMIDDRPTYLSGDDLNNLLSSMNAAQVSRIELIPNPTARYDAAGSAGIINIKTKKSNSYGLNGSFTTTYGQGVYPKSNNSLVLNYRKGSLNFFFNYSYSASQYLTDLFAYRNYFDGNKDVIATLRQPTYFKGTVYNNTLKTGAEFDLSPATTIGLALTGVDIRRNGNNTAHADWLKADGSVDSSILTTSTPWGLFRNGGVNLHARQRLSKDADLNADLDYLDYPIERRQDFDNQLLAPGGYTEVFRSNIPTSIQIFSGKIDASLRVSPMVTLQAGLKSSSNHTDNAATYENLDNQQWVEDDSRSNHFIYRENIRAGYASIEGKARRLSYQAGLRYEYTSYTTHQLGNATQQDSTVSRDYQSWFPSGYLSYSMDSLNSLTFTTARRVDRPPFQNLNPFLYIINKYTYETGNPYLLPQYSWNFELSYKYAELLTAGLSYSRLSNYFSQIFLSDTSKTILYYTQGNVGGVDNLGLSASLSWHPVKGWSMELTAVYNYKQLKGFNGNNYSSTINQLNVNANNQFDFGNGYTGEVSGFYTTRSREDIQELLYPAGQVSAGLSKAILKKKGSLKLSCRDIFYTSAMEGLTSFPDASEYFKIKRDSRILALSFTFRFGKSFNSRRHQDGATEEKERTPNE
ncbi:MAG: TonB-dependent receptor [Bacteroidota bacterium]|nr:TonB-dependent receptor [Bacteroidota bacterium]MDP4259786.1 TonB-dependent receptor [Bacteroidota bacterium]